MFQLSSSFATIGSAEVDYVKRAVATACGAPNAYSLRGVARKHGSESVVLSMLDVCTGKFYEAHVYPDNSVRPGQQTLSDRLWPLLHCPTVLLDCVTGYCVSYVPRGDRVAFCVMGHLDVDESSTYMSSDTIHRQIRDRFAPQGFQQVVVNEYSSPFHSPQLVVYTLSDHTTSSGTRWSVSSTPTMSSCR